jgi:hypothetical protein
MPALGAANTVKILTRCEKVQKRRQGRPAASDIHRDAGVGRVFLD